MTFREKAQEIVDRMRKAIKTNSIDELEGIEKDVEDVLLMAGVGEAQIKNKIEEVLIKVQRVRALDVEISRLEQTLRKAD